MCVNWYVNLYGCVTEYELMCLLLIYFHCCQTYFTGVTSLSSCAEKYTFHTVCHQSSGLSHAKDDK